MQPLVTVLTVTYQHALYIEQCVDSVMAQRTTFPVEHLIGEDGSTDGTREICQRLAAEHPDRIRLFLRDRNDVLYIDGKPTGRSNFVKLLGDAKGRYIALCEGDDYWTDPLKLQKQVEFLEMNPSYAMCFHRADMLRNGARKLHAIPADIDLDNVTLDDLLRTYNFITTASVVYRNVTREMPSWFWEVPFGDLALHAIVSQHGRIKCMDEVMSVYRINDSGSWSGLDERARCLSYLRFYDVIEPHLTPVQRSIVDKKRGEYLDRLAELRWPDSWLRRFIYRKFLVHKQRS
jgi:glycosyltransferase involved in cell wall biosynthesis